MKRVDFEDGELQAIATMMDIAIKTIGITLLRTPELANSAVSALAKMESAKEIKPKKAPAKNKAAGKA